MEIKCLEFYGNIVRINDQVSLKRPCCLKGWVSTSATLCPASQMEANYYMWQQV